MNAASFQEKDLTLLSVFALKYKSICGCVKKILVIPSNTTLLILIKQGFVNKSRIKLVTINSKLVL